QSNRHPAYPSGQETDEHKHLETLHSGAGLPHRSYRRLVTIFLIHSNPLEQRTYLSESIHQYFLDCAHVRLLRQFYHLPLLLPPTICPPSIPAKHHEAVLHAQTAGFWLHPSSLLLGVRLKQYAPSCSASYHHQRHSRLYPQRPSLLQSRYALACESFEG